MDRHSLSSTGALSPSQSREEGSIGNWTVNTTPLEVWGRGRDNIWPPGGTSSEGSSSVSSGQVGGPVVEEGGKEVESHNWGLYGNGGMGEWGNGGMCVCA